MNQLHEGSERGSMGVDFGFGVGMQSQAQFL
jgi:hypothetical protein